MLRQPGQVDGREEALPLLQCGRRAVVRERHPRSQRSVVRLDGVVVLGAELEAEPSVGLSVTAPGDDGVDVHLVDLAGEAVARGGVLGRALRQQHHHHRGASVVMTEIGHTGR